MGCPGLGAKLSEVPRIGLEATTAGGKSIVEAMSGCMLLGKVGDMTGGEPQKTGQWWFTARGALWWCTGMGPGAFVGVGLHRNEATGCLSGHSRTVGRQRWVRLAG